MPTFKRRVSPPAAALSLAGNRSTKAFTLRPATPVSLRSTFSPIALRKSCGVPRIDDFNGADQNGAGGYPVDVVNGVRQNTALVFLPAGEMMPGDSVDDDGLAEVVAANLAVYGHPTSTAPMGWPADPWAVVDSVGRVRGVDRLRVVDSHTGGEPTRIVVSGGPELGRGSMAERCALLRDRYDWLRSAVIQEPRGSP